MAIGTPVAGTVAYSASAGGTVSPAYPAGMTAQHAVVLIVGQKPATANAGSVTTPTGFTLRESLVGAGGYATTLGADTGNTNLFVYTKDVVTGSETGTIAVALGGNGVAWAVLVRVPVDSGVATFAASDGSDTSAGSVSVALAANPGLAAGDVALWAMCIPTDVTTPAQFSAHAITAAGATFGAATELIEPDSGTGNDIGGYLAWASVASGASTGVPTITATAGGTTTDVRGPLVLLRLREVVVQALAGGATGEGDASGALGLAKALAGSAEAQASASGALSFVHLLQGTAQAQATASGTLASGGVADLAGAAQAQAAASAALSVGVTLAGTALATAGASGALSKSAALAGLATVVAAANGTLALSVGLVGPALAQAAASGLLTHGVPLQGQAVGQASSSGALSHGVPLQGSAQGQAQAGAVLAVAINLACAAQAQAQAAGTLQGGASLAGNAQAQGFASGTLWLQVPLQGQAVAQAAASGGLVLTVLLDGAAQATAQAAGSLTVPVLLTGAAGAQVLASGTLQAGPPLAVVGGVLHVRPQQARKFNAHSAARSFAARSPAARALGAWKVRA